MLNNLVFYIPFYSCTVLRRIKFLNVIMIYLLITARSLTIESTIPCFGSQTSSANSQSYNGKGGRPSLSPLAE